MSRLEEFTQRRWRCPHCRKSWSKRATATQHVGLGCHRNPATRTCATCRHYQPGHPPSYEDPGIEHGCMVGVGIADMLVFELPRQCPWWSGYPEWTR